jgi:hypothetical protein
MEDCEGGFVEILGGNKNAVYRFNVSVNDGWRQHPTWKNSNHTIWINNTSAGDQIKYCDSSYIYNNTVYIDRNFTTAIEVNAKNTFIYNNIFSSVNSGMMGGQNVKVESNGTPLFMRNNLFYGAVDPRFKNLDETRYEGNPLFIMEGMQEMRFRIDSLSPAMDRGVARQGPRIPGAGKGVFRDISPYPEVDVFGNPVDFVNGTLNIGACNIKFISDTNLVSIQEWPEAGELMIWPNPAGSQLNLYIPGEGTDHARISLSDLRGKLLLEEKISSKGIPNRFILELHAGIPDGIYLVRIEKGEDSWSRRMIFVR